ncbi:MAG: hypothetical protein ACOYVK_16165 [Bacillota bacterium]
MYTKVIEWLGFKPFYRNMTVLYGMVVLFVTFIFMVNTIKNFQVKLIGDYIVQLAAVYLFARIHQDILLKRVGEKTWVDRGKYFR